MFYVRAYTIWNTTFEWTVVTVEKAREYAKRIVMEGLWYKVPGSLLDEEEFLPVDKVAKVRIGKVEE